MNFVAGFLYLVLKDEEKTFKALGEMVELYDMDQLFKSELPRLKLFFYQFDRILSIMSSPLNSHFKVIP